MTCKNHATSHQRSSGNSDQINKRINIQRAMASWKVPKCIHKTWSFPTEQKTKEGPTRVKKPGIFLSYVFPQKGNS